MLVECPRARIVTTDMDRQLAVEWWSVGRNRALFEVSGGEAELSSVSVHTGRVYHSVGRPELEDIPAPVRRLLQSYGYDLAERG